MNHHQAKPLFLMTYLMALKLKSCKVRTKDPPPKLPFLIILQQETVSKPITLTIEAVLNSPTHFEVAFSHKYKKVISL